MPVSTNQRDGALILELTGMWAMEQSPPRFSEAVGEADGAVEAVGFDTSGLEDWDSSLLAFLVEGEAYCEEHDLDFQEETLPENITRLLELSRAAPDQDVQRDEEESSRLARFGAWGLAAYDGFLAFAGFVGSFARSVGGLLRFRVQMRGRDFWVVIQRNSSGALPIVALISFLIGVIIAFLGAVVLRRFGADYYVSYLVSYGVLREMGAVMTAIIMAGRTGAAFAAEIGSMKITEEIDALKTLGISPIDYLVLPRVLAIFLMMPLLTIYADVIGILGGLVVTVSIVDVSVPQFLTGLLTPVALPDALLGVFKGTVFGLIIGLAGCLRGLQTGDDAGAVGEAATSAVVTAITLIILANAVIDWAAAVLNV